MSDNPNFMDVLCAHLADDEVSGRKLLCELAGGVDRTCIPHWRQRGHIPGKHLRDIWTKALERGRPIPAALLIGVDPDVDRVINSPTDIVPQRADTAHAES